MNAQVSYYFRALVLGVTAALALCLLALAFGAPPAAAQEQTADAVVAWGENGESQSTVPPGLGNAKAISAGVYHSLALGDLAAPVAPVITAPSEGSYDNDGSFTLSGSAEAASTVELFEGALRKSKPYATSRMLAACEPAICLRSGSEFY